MKISVFFLCVGLMVNLNAFGNISSEIGKGLIKGSVYDVNTNSPLEYATISVFDAKNDSLVGGTITGSSGSFKLKNLEYGSYKIEITFMGYERRVVNKTVDKADSNIDLGTISLNPAVQSLGEVVVTSDIPTVSYKIDKKVINVSQYHASASGTAIDILETYPSIAVGINGEVSLRGSTSFTVLIDNRPTILEPGDVLNQIPASTIENIEIITNPSAKHDSQGTSGIINIITKKNKLQGFTGMAKLSGGMYNNYGGDILFSVKDKKFGYFIGAHLNQRGIDGSFESENWTRLNDTTFYVNSEGEYALIKRSTGVRGGIDFDIKTNNTFNFQFGFGHWISAGEHNMDYREYTQPVTSSNLFTSEEDPDKSGLFYNLDLNYIHRFKKEGHEISALIYYNRKDFDDIRNSKLINSLNEQVSGYESSEVGPVDLYNLQLDYTLPMGENRKLEAGYKSNIMDYDIGGEVQQYNPISEEYELNNDFLYQAKFDKDIHALYTTYSGKLNKFGYQFGLRAEYTNRKMLVAETNEDFLIERFDYFPGVHFSYEIPKKQQLMASYSRRINRPDNWRIEPFYTWHDAYNVRVGNPELEPEYINVYELSYMNRFNKNRLTLDVYYKETDNAYERIRGVYEENIFVSTYQNIGKNYSFGAELSLSLSLVKWWNINLTGNFYDYRIKGELNNEDFSNSGFRWTSRIQNSFRFGKTTSAQLYTMYKSPYVTPQGDNEGYFMTNLSLKQNFLKNYSATLQVTGVFGFLERSKKFEGGNYYIEHNIVPYTPIVNLTVSYLINQYKYDRRKHKNTGDMDDGEGGGF